MKGKLVSFLFILAFAVVALLLGVVAPVTFLENTEEALRKGDFAEVFLFLGMCAASLVAAAVFLILLNKIRQATLAFLDEKAEGKRGKEERPETFRTVAKPGIKERFLLAALIFLTFVLCVTGYGQYTALTREELYWQLSFVHSALGALTVLVLVLYLFQLSRRHFSLKVCLLLTFYPFMYLLVQQSPGPLLANYISINLVLLPAGIFLLARKETAPERRMSLILASAALYAFTLVAMTGMFPIIDPVKLRFAFRHRALHSCITPIAALLPVYYYYLRGRGGRAITPKEGRRGLFVGGALVLAGIALGTGMHEMKNFRLENLRRENRYLSASLAAKEGAEFRVMRPGVMSDDRFCGGCHEIPFRQWERSAHANAARIITFQKVVKALMEKHGDKIARDCAACHDPEAALLKDPRALVDPERLARSQGVSCRSCHYMTVAGDKNAYYALDLPRSDLTPREVVMRRLRAYYESDLPRSDVMPWETLMRRFRILVTVQEHVGDVTKPITGDGRVCFPCHSLRSMRNGHEQVPYDNVTSFQESSFGRTMPCHRCHMPRIEKDDRSYSWMDHSFFGIQRELPAVIIAPDARLKSELEIFTKDTEKWLAGRLPVLDTFEVWMDESFKSYRFTGYMRRRRELIETAKVSNGGSHFSMRLKKAEINGSSLELVFSTKNLKAGHDFPSSLFANISDVWFELELTDARGRKIYRSRLDRNDLAHQIGRIEVDAGGRRIAPDESLKYVTIINRKFLKPGKEYDDAYSIPIGAEVRFPVKAAYRLKYRRYNDEFVKWLAEESITPFPARVMAEKAFAVQGVEKRILSTDERR